MTPWLGQERLKLRQSLRNLRLAPQPTAGVRRHHHGFAAEILFEFVIFRQKRATGFEPLSRAS